MVGAALGMADDDGGGARVRQHLGRDIARMGAGSLGMAILRPDRDLCTLRFAAKPASASPADRPADRPCPPVPRHPRSSPEFGRPKPSGRSSSSFRQSAAAAPVMDFINSESCAHTFEQYRSRQNAEVRAGLSSRGYRRGPVPDTVWRSPLSLTAAIAHAAEVATGRAATL